MVAILGLVALSAVLQVDRTFTYTGGLLLAGIASLVLVVVVSRPGTHGPVLLEPDPHLGRGPLVRPVPVVVAGPAVRPGPAARCIAGGRRSDHRARLGAAGLAVAEVRRAAAAFPLGLGGGAGTTTGGLGVRSGRGRGRNGAVGGQRRTRDRSARRSAPPSRSTWLSPRLRRRRRRPRPRRRHPPPRPRPRPPRRPSRRRSRPPSLHLLRRRLPRRLHRRLRPG